jgi:hypothetical protein
MSANILSGNVARRVDSLQVTLSVTVIICCGGGGGDCVNKYL